ncbi:MAG: HNH endonuclease [Spirochaetaceae bacterium]|nr:HNH endonuclease [Spirochaetaceae bacterium]
MSESLSPTLWSTVAALPDYLLLAQTRQLARHEQALQILVLDHLHEIEARRLHLTRGYGSLFDYVVHELGYTAAAAWRRIKAMRLCSQTGGARELLQDGSLNLSNAAQLQNLFERSDRSRGRPPVSDGNGGGLGEAPRSGGAPAAPAPAAPIREGERDAAPAAGPVLDAAAREELVRQAAGKSTREVQQMLAEVDPELAQPSDRVRALGGGRWELKAAVDAECRHGLEKLQMLLSHSAPHLTLGGLVARLVRDGLDRYDPERPPRARRTGGHGSVTGAGSASKPARRDTEPVQRNVVVAEGNDTGAVERSGARAEGGGVERHNEVERDDASFGAAVRNGTARPSAAKRPAEAEHGSTKSAAGRDGGGRTDTAAQRHTGAERSGAKSAAARDIVRGSDSAARRPWEAEHGGALLVAVPNSGGHTASPAERQSAAELGLASRAVAGDGGGQDAHIEDAERLCGGAASAPGCRRETEHACGQPNGIRGSGGGAASPAKRHGRGDGDDRDAGVGGVQDRATCAAGPRFEADRRSASLAPERGGCRFPTSAAKRLAYAAGLGAVAPAERSPALERHLAALSCVGAVPGSRSRYIPAAVKREVWRRDQGCCSYVDPHSGRRCGSRYRLEIDHIVPFALGGGAEPENLRLRCGAHHRLRHARRHA